MRKTFAEWVARVLSFTDGALSLGAKPTGSQVLGLSGGVVQGVDASTLLAGTFQPLDSDLTAIAALATTTFGRGALVETSPVVDPASPYTVASKVRAIVFTDGAAKTINLIALSDLTDGEVIWIYNQSTSSVTYTIDPPTGATLNGGADGASAAFTVAARGAVGVQRLSSATWGSVQLNTPAPACLTFEVSGGAIIGYAEAYIGGTLTRVGGNLSPDTSSDPETWGFSLSGSDIALTTGAGVINTALRTEAPVWTYDISRFGVTMPTSTAKMIGLDASVSSITLTSPAAADYNGIGISLSTTATASASALYAAGVCRSNTNYARLADDADAPPITFEVGSTLRRCFFAESYPLDATGTHPFYGYDSTGDLIATGNGATNAATGSGLYVNLWLVKLGTPRAGTIAAPKWRLWL